MVNLGYTRCYLHTGLKWITVENWFHGLTVAIFVQYTVYTIHYVMYTVHCIVNARWSTRRLLLLLLTIINNMKVPLLCYCSRLSGLNTTRLDHYVYLSRSLHMHGLTTTSASLDYYVCMTRPIPGLTIWSTWISVAYEWFIPIINNVLTSRQA